MNRELLKVPNQGTQGVVRLQRIANWLHRHRLSLFSRLLEIYIRVIFAAVLPASVRLGRNVHFGHSGFATIVNSSCKIGDNCFIGSHVILGGDTRSIGAPVIESDVVIHAGCMIIGPITIGRGSVIAAQSLVNKDVKPFSLIMGQPGRVVAENINPDEYVMH
jgi:serine O-acetyltransferase